MVRSAGHAKPGADAVAAGWVAREDRGPLDAGEREALAAWLRADARHFGAYARARAVFAQTRRVASAAAAGPGAATGPAVAPNRRGGRARLAAAAAIAALAWLLHGHAPVGGLPAGIAYRTGLGEVLRMPLADGSVVTLDSRSEVRVAYTAGRRDVRLLRGEALFDVAHDRARPFVVHSGDATVTAVGTSFAVAAPVGEGGAVRVLVREGRVDVAPAGRASRVARLEANQAAAARADAAVRVERLAPESVRDRLAWREGMLAFQGDTLAEAADRFGRYSRVRIVIDDPGLARRRVAGLYSANDPAGFARSVALSLGVVAERRGEAIHLRQAARPARRE